MYLSHCHYSILNRSLLVLTDAYGHRICRATLCQHATKLLSTSSKNCRESDFGNKSRHLTFCRHRQNGPGICSSKYKINLMHPPVRFFNEFQNEGQENDKKKPVKFSTSKDKISGGKYTDENKLMPSFPIYVFPNLAGIFENIMAGSRIKKVDGDLTVLGFLTAAKKAVFVIANLLSSGNIDEVENLTTPKAFQQIKENYSKIPETHLQALGQDEDRILIPLRHVHRVRLRYKVKDHPEVEADEATLEIVVLFDGYKKKAVDEEAKIFTNMRDRTRFCCTARFEREYSQLDSTTWESSAPWKVSGISYIIREPLEEEIKDYII
ncbi:uncharacterized protein LOC117315766 [Pecten maximus]|uniref:uncharacterized protein LOC117315766 n=1 Tax=Pecten maximus TaxID=6579 RepID=UPI001458EE46|nr:uncharacterized protein LOC117315766 [Pecten maximus]